MPVDPYADRMSKSDAIVNSTSVRRLVVAGPGTGKSYTFSRALSAVGGAGLALTFIRSLVADLKKELGNLATVDTFHGYCKGKLHAFGGAGIGADFRMYPNLFDLIAADLQALGIDCDRALLQARFDEIDQTDGLITMALDLGEYYKAVSFVDSVYRLTAYFDANPADIPTYPLVVVDEYQDFNRLETELITQLAQKSHVLIAGDDDQALYDKKHAHPDFIRNLATGGSFDVFDLPYCSRCTYVVVEAVKRVIARASQLHLLDGRLDKTFEPFPDKKAESDANPQIIHADCSVQRNNTPYVSMYVDQQIKAISAGDIEASYKGRHPTVLVIGPSYFVEQVADYLTAQGHQVELRMTAPSGVDLADGYRFLASESNSRLGWRIVHSVVPCEQVDEQLVATVFGDGNLADAFCQTCHDDHMTHVDLVRRLFQNQPLSPEEEQALRERLNETGDLMTRLADWKDEGEEKPLDETRPRVVCTSLTGSKGLSAQHVFVVGANDGDFPRNPAAIEPLEVCQLIVALSRTRKLCYLVSCRRFGGAKRTPSTFIGWLGDLVDHRRVDKNYW